MVEFRRVGIADKEIICGKRESGGVGVMALMRTQEKAEKEHKRTNNSHEREENKTRLHKK